MTNRDKYAQEILDIILSRCDATVAVKLTSGTPTLCNDESFPCSSCLFNSANECYKAFVCWANEECKEDKENEKAINSLVVDYLNEKTGKHYRATNKTTVRCINARLKEGYDISDFNKVIDIKVDEWIGTEYEKYLSPETLFGNKFDKYLNQSEKKQSENKRSSKWGD